MDELCYVKLQNNLKQVDLEARLTLAIKKKIVDLPNHIDLRLDSEIILLVCNLVENTVFNKTGKKKKIPIDKKRMVIKILDSIYTYSELEKVQVSNKIEFLYLHNQIKKVSALKKYSSLILEWLKKKLL